MGKDAGAVTDTVWLYWQDDPTEELAASGLRKFDSSHAPCPDACSLATFSC